MADVLEQPVAQPEMLVAVSKGVAASGGSGAPASPLRHPEPAAEPGARCKRAKVGGLPGHDDGSAPDG